MMKKTFITALIFLTSIFSVFAELSEVESPIAHKVAHWNIQFQKKIEKQYILEQQLKLASYHQFGHINKAQNGLQHLSEILKDSFSIFNAHPKPKAKVLPSAYTEKLERDVKLLNKQIVKNERLKKEGKVLETTFIVDLRAARNNAAFLQEPKFNEINSILQTINNEAGAGSEKPAFYVLLNMFFPHDERIKTMSGQSREDYLTQYTQELYERSQLTSNGILLNIESFIELEELELIGFDANNAPVKKPHFNLTYQPFIGLGSMLKDTSLDQLIQTDLLNLSKKPEFEFAVQGTATSGNKPHRGDILEAYVNAIRSIINDQTDGDDDFFGDETNSEFFVDLDLTDEEKQALLNILKTANTKPVTTTNLKDYAGVDVFLARLFGNYYSRLFNEPDGLNLKVITTSAYNTHKGQTAIQLVKEEAMNPSTLLLGLHFLNTPDENAEKVSIRFTVKYGSAYDQEVKSQLGNIWNDIGLLKWSDHINDAEGNAYSSFMFILDAVSEVLNQVRIPNKWWDGDNWYNLDPYFSGLVNGILDDVTGLIQLAILGGKASASIAHLGFQLKLFAYEMATNPDKREQVLSDLQEIKGDLFPILKNGALGFVTFFAELQVPDTDSMKDFKFFFPKGIGYGLTAQEQLDYFNNIAALEAGQPRNIQDLVLNFSPFLLAFNTDLHILTVNYAVQLGADVWKKISELTDRQVEYYKGYATVQILACFVGIGEIVAVVKGLNAAAKTFKLADEVADGIKAIRNSGEKTVAGFIQKLRDFARSVDKTPDTDGIARVRRKLEDVVAGANRIPESLASKFSSDGLTQLQSWLAKYSTAIGDDAGSLLAKLETDIGSKVVLDVLEDGQGRLLVQVEGANRNTVFSIMEKHDGSFVNYKFEPTYKPSANPDIPVPISANKLAPDYAGTQYLYPTSGNQRNIVRIKMTGKRGSNTGDFHAANREAGFVDEFGSNAPVKVIDGEEVQYTWHHLDDMEIINGEAYCTMQLVEQAAHTRVKGFGHSGSAAQWKAYYGSADEAPNGLYYDN